MRNRTNVPRFARYSSMTGAFAGLAVPDRTLYCLAMATELGSRLDQGITLPFSWFADPEVFALEQERIFAHTWQYAGVADWVAEPGQFFTCRAGLVPVVVTRDQAGSLNAFVNICRHRATEVAQGRGRRETLQCPYHAWTYGLDGCLRAAPRSQLEPGFDRSQLGLLPVAVDTWGPLVFVNRDLDAPPLADVLGGLPALLEGCGFSFDGLRFRERVEWELAANWKAVVENFLECYHCPTAHPSFSKMIDVDPDAYMLSSAGWSSSQVARVRDDVQEGGGAPPYWPSGAAAGSAHFHYLWPTFTINALPGPPNAAVFFFVPLDAGRTLTITDYLFDESADQQQIREVMAFGDQVGSEDRELVESIQRAAASGGLDHGRLMLSSEHLIQHFQRLVEQALA
jgi:phenylpropionate dioxygenase-like ring-hydroxylating dioxygenase large terminal subunit